MSQVADSGVEMRDSWSIRPPRPVNSRCEITVRGWCHEYGTIPALVPFEFRQFNPIKVLLDIREAIDEAPLTKATFLKRELLGDLGHRSIRSTYGTEILRLAGCWEYCGTSRLPDDMPTKRWANPKYVHANADPSIADYSERIEEMRRAASIGNVTQEDLADRFGITVSAVEEYCYYHDIPWEEWRTWGKQRLARSLKIALEWTNHHITTEELSNAVGVPKGTIKSWFSEQYASDFDVPADPSGEPWFQSNAREETPTKIPKCLTGAPTQSRVYLALCKLGDGEHFASDIIDQTDLSKHAVHNALDRLRERDIIGHRKVKSTWWAHWTDPEIHKDGIPHQTVSAGNEIDLKLLGPAQREALEALRDAGSELRCSEVADRIERSTGAAGQALRHLCSRDLVEKRQIDPRGWHGYRLAGTEPTLETREYGEKEQQVLSVLEGASDPLPLSEIEGRTSVLDSKCIYNTLGRLRDKGVIETRVINNTGWLEYWLDGDENGGVDS